MTDQGNQESCKDLVTVQVLRRTDGGYLVRLTRVQDDGEAARSDFPVEEHEGGLAEAEALAVSIKNFVELGLDPSVFLPGSVEPS